MSARLLLVEDDCDIRETLAKLSPSDGLMLKACKVGPRKADLVFTTGPFAMQTLRSAVMVTGNRGLLAGPRLLTALIVSYEGLARTLRA